MVPSDPEARIGKAVLVEVSAKINTLLDIAQANIGDAAGTYTAEDAAAASTYTAI